MTDRNDNLTTSDDIRDRDVAYTAPGATPAVAGQPLAAQPVMAQPVAAQPVAAQPVVAQPVVAETEPDHRSVITEVDRPSRVPAFLAGFATAIVVAAIAFVAFLAVSDSDDDGNIDVDVPAVEVETDIGG